MAETRERKPDKHSLNALLAEEGALDESELQEMAEKDFSAGFGGDDEISTEVKPQPAEDEEESGEEEGEKPAANQPEPVVDQKDKTITQLQSQVRDLQGKFGELNSRLKNQTHSTASEAAKAAGGKVPTRDELMQGLKDEESRKKFKDDFPEYHDQLEIQERIFEKKISEKMPDTSGYISKSDFQKAINEAKLEARSLSRLDNRHPEWQSKVYSGDSDEIGRYPGLNQNFSIWLSSQDDKTKSLFDSENINDTIALLDKYEEYSGQQKKVEDESLKRDREKELSKRRLESAVSPTSRSTVANSRSVRTPEDDFEEGFKTG